jgi:hypothetical protein
MDGALHEEMSNMVFSSAFSDEKSFWYAVYQKLFPAYTAMESINLALSSYMIWNEAMGIERWAAVTQSMIEHVAVLSGKSGMAHEQYVAEHMYRQMHRVIHNSKEACSAVLHREFLSHTVDIEMAVEDNLPVTTEMYRKAYKSFFKFLTKWLNIHTYVLTFGYAQAVHKKQAQSQPSSPSLMQAHSSTPVMSRNQSPIIRQIYTASQSRASSPSYSQVVSEGGRGMQGNVGNKMHGSAAAKHRPDQRGRPKVADIAPTGIRRTWTSSMKGLTMPDSGVRQDLWSSPPPACDNPQCQYLGDWLDFQGLCAYCEKPGHKRHQCAKLLGAQAMWQASKGQSQINPRVAKQEN